MNTPAFPCSTAPSLFDSAGGPDDPDVHKAKALCHTCPAIFVCRQRGRDGREWGVWGGESQIERFAALGVTESDILPPECETEAAYRRHRDNGEDCEECRKAHNARQLAYTKEPHAARPKLSAKRQAERDAAQAAIEATRPSPEHSPLRPQCGTANGYKIHGKNGELRLIPHPDCTCRVAHAAKRMEERNRKNSTKELVSA